MTAPAWFCDPNLRADQKARLNRDWDNQRRRPLRPVASPADITDASRFPNINQAIAAVRSDPDRWDKAQKEWDV